MSDRFAAHCQRMAEYNARANTVLYDAVADLDDTAYRAKRPAFFDSIHGTLNHILLGDRIWMTRFEGGVYAYSGLDEEQYSDFAELRAARHTMDQRILSFMADRLDDAFLELAITYVNNAGVRVTDPVVVLLPHLFNHQTHHRGQVHDMLSQTTVAPPSLDLHRILNPT